MVVKTQSALPVKVLRLPNSTATKELPERAQNPLHARAVAIPRGAVGISSAPADVNRLRMRSRSIWKGNAITLVSLYSGDWLPGDYYWHNRNGTTYRVRPENLREFRWNSN